MTSRTNARIAGFCFLFYIAIGITQMVLGRSTSAEDMTQKLVLIAQHGQGIRIDILLGVLMCVNAVVLAVSLFGITREVDRDLAVLVLSFRLGESMLAIVGTLCTLGLQWLAGAGTTLDRPTAIGLGELFRQVGSWNVTLAATLFAVGSTVFSWLLVRGRLVPVGLAWLGVVASVLLVVALPLSLVDVVPGSVVGMLWLPMAAFEIPLALWLLIKGVRPVAPPVAIEVAHLR
jgi:hypothetical protein